MNEWYYFRDGRGVGRVRVVTDPKPYDPRERKNKAHMLIWHDRVKGDEKDIKKPDEYVRGFLERVPAEDLVEFARSYRAENGLRLSFDRCGELYTLFCNVDGVERRVAASGRPRELARVIREKLTIPDCWKVLEDTGIYMQPLYIQEGTHGTSICTDADERFVPFGDATEAGWKMCGWIWINKKKVRSLSDDWKHAASEIVEREVAIYDKFLHKECYGIETQFCRHVDNPYIPERNFWEPCEKFFGFYSEEYGYGLVEEIVQKTMGNLELYFAFEDAALAAA